MKKHLLLLFLLNFSCLFAQKDEMLQTIDNEINKLEGFLKLQNSELSFDYVKNEDLDKNPNVYAVRKKFDPNFFDKIPIEIETYFPNTVAELKFNEYDLMAMLGGNSLFFTNFPEKKPVLIPRTIQYFNGTSEDAKNVYIDDKNLRGYQFDSFLFKTVKPIKSITFDITTNFGNITSYFISKGDKEIRLANTIIRIEKFDENYISLIIPKELQDKIMIHGIHKNGEYLNEKGRFSKKFNTESQSLMKVREALTAAKEKVQKNEISTQKELDNFLKGNLPKIKKRADSDAEIKTIYFTALVDKIEITYSDDAPKKTIQKTFDTADYYLKKIQKQPFTYCQDSESGKFGIVDLDGNWFIPPTFNKISQLNFIPYHFQVAVTEKENFNHHWFWLDVASKKLTEVNYKPEVWEKRNNGELIIIQDPLTKKNGLLNPKDGKMLVPYVYDGLAFSKEGFLYATIMASKESKTGIITLENKVMVPIEFEYVRKIGPHFAGHRDLQPDKLYDSQGKLITEDYFLYDSEFSEGLLKAEKRKEISKAECDKSDFCAISSANGIKKYYEVQQFHFLNEKGESKFHLERSQYKSVKDFHNGLALVESIDGKFGYIDTNGKIKITPQYSYSLGMNFYGKYAVVDIDDESWFIDQNGNKIFKLPSGVYSADREKIWLFNKSEYNFNGEIIKP